MIVKTGAKNTFGAIVVHVISAKIGAAGPETPIFAVCVS
jgi:hypothetical protein